MDPAIARLLGICIREDGTFERIPDVPRIEASAQFQDGVASRDVCFDEGKGLWARIFLPEPHTTIDTLYPLVLYFHGGGFVLLSNTHFIYHSFLHNLAKAARVIIVSVEYRLAPEHRLPAAYDDCLAALTWLKSQASKHAHIHEGMDPWLRTYADFSQCFLMGDSAGGNIVHNLSLKLGNINTDVMRIRGHILIQTFFGGVKRTQTEVTGAEKGGLTLAGTDWMWENALPEGADRDHPACNPMKIPVTIFKEAGLPKTIIVIGQEDLMKERQMQYYGVLKEAGVDVQVQLYDGQHGFFLEGQILSYAALIEAGVDVQEHLYDAQHETEAAKSFMKDLAGWLHPTTSDD